MLEDFGIDAIAETQKDGGHKNEAGGMTEAPPGKRVRVRGQLHLSKLHAPFHHSCPFLLT